MNGPPDLSLTQIAFAVGLIVVNAAISICLQLGLGRALVVASLRTVVQLALVGLLLESVFSSRSPLLVVGLLVAMTVMAGWTAGSRSASTYRGNFCDALLSTWVSSWLAASFAVIAIFRPDAGWLDPSLVIPLLGMILGNSLTGVSLGMNAFTESVVSHREEIEMLLALGATRWEATRRLIVDAVRTGMIPIINSMTVVGVVSLPGMMTGQLLAGADPMIAVKYQIVIMFVIASATAMGTVGVVLLAFRRHLTPDHRIADLRATASS